MCKDFFIILYKICFLWNAALSIMSTLLDGNSFKIWLNSSKELFKALYIPRSNAEFLK